MSVQISHYLSDLLLVYYSILDSALLANGYIV